MALVPPASSAFAVPAAAAASTSRTATWRPCLASPWQTACPIPDPPPVTIATRLIWPPPQRFVVRLYSDAIRSYKVVGGGAMAGTQLYYDPYDREIDRD